MVQSSEKGLVSSDRMLAGHDLFELVQPSPASSEKTIFHTLLTTDSYDILIYTQTSVKVCQLLCQWNEAMVVLE